MYQRFAYAVTMFALGSHMAEAQLDLSQYRMMYSDPYYSYNPYTTTPIYSTSMSSAFEEFAPWIDSGDYQTTEDYVISSQKRAGKFYKNAYTGSDSGSDSGSESEGEYNTVYDYKEGDYGQPLFLEENPELYEEDLNETPYEYNLYDQPYDSSPYAADLE